MFKQLFFFCVSPPTVLPLSVDSFLSHKSLSIVLDHCIAAGIEDHYVLLYHIYAMFSWFCSFHSASIPGGLSSSHGIPPVHYSFEFNSIPLPTDTTICLAIPQLKDIGTEILNGTMTLGKYGLLNRNRNGKREK